jgi:hypothetical protein
VAGAGNLATQAVGYAASAASTAATATTVASAMATAASWQIGTVAHDMFKAVLELLTLDTAMTTASFVLSIGRLFHGFRSGPRGKLNVAARDMIPAVLTLLQFSQESQSLVRNAAAGLAAASTVAVSIYGTGASVLDAVDAAGVTKAVHNGELAATGKYMMVAEASARVDDVIHTVDTPTKSELKNAAKYKQNAAQAEQRRMYPEAAKHEDYMSLLNESHTGVTRDLLRSLYHFRDPSVTTPATVPGATVWRDMQQLEIGPLENNAASSLLTDHTPATPMDSTCWFKPDEARSTSGISGSVSVRRMSSEGEHDWTKGAAHVQALLGSLAYAQHAEMGDVYKGRVCSIYTPARVAAMGNATVCIRPVALPEARSKHWAVSAFTTHRDGGSVADSPIPCLDTGVSDQSLSSGWHSQRIATLHMPREPTDIGVLTQNMYETGGVDPDDKSAPFIRCVSAVGSVCVYPELCAPSPKDPIDITPLQYYSSVMEKGFNVCMVLTADWTCRGVLSADSVVLPNIPVSNDMTHFTMDQSYKRLIMLNTASIRLSVPTDVCIQSPLLRTLMAAAKESPVTIGGFVGGVAVYNACLGADPRVFSRDGGKMFAYSWMLVLDYETNDLMRKRLRKWFNKSNRVAPSKARDWLQIWANQIYIDLVQPHMSVNVREHSKAEVVDRFMRNELQKVMGKALHEFPSIMVRHVRPRVSKEDGSYQLRDVVDHVDDLYDRARVYYAARQKPGNLGSIYTSILHRRDRKGAEPDPATVTPTPTHNPPSSFEERKASPQDQLESMSSNPVLDADTIRHRRKPRRQDQPKIMSLDSVQAEDLRKRAFERNILSGRETRGQDQSVRISSNPVLDADTIRHRKKPQRQDQPKIMSLDAVQAADLRKHAFERNILSGRETRGQDQSVRISSNPVLDADTIRHRKKPQRQDQPKIMSLDAVQAADLRKHAFERNIPSDRETRRQDQSDRISSNPVPDADTTRRANNRRKLQQLLS